MKVIGIGVVVLAIVIAVAYMLMTPGGQQPTETTPTATGATQPSTSPTSTQKTPTITAPTNTTVGANVSTPIRLSAEIKYIQPTQEESMEGVVAKIKLTITITNKGDETVYVSTIYPDNIKPGSSHPLEEDVCLYFDPPIKLNPGESVTKGTIAYIYSEDLANQWAIGTKHVINVVYRVDGGSSQKASVEVEVSG